MPLHDESGALALWVGSATDIDDQKKAQATLRRDRDELEALVAARTSELRRANENLQAEVAERTATESALRRSEERFRAFMNASTIVAFMKDHDNRFVYVNEAMCAAFSLPAERWQGRTLFDLFPPDVARRIDEYDAQVLAGDGTQTRIEAIPTPDGAERLWLSYKFPLRDEAGRKYLGGLAFDVSDQQRAERDLRLLADELARSNRELEQFAYVASHDLQEPLRMVVSYLQLLERRHADKLDGSALEFLAFAVDGARRMQTLINDLLDYSRVGRRARPFAPVDLDRTLDDVLRVFSVAIAESGALVHREKLPTIQGDASQLARLLQNLVGNALKFRGPQPPEISISCRNAGDEWEIAVRDNGIGIAPEHFERIFAVFQRLHARDQYEGTGIGLAVVKKIAERHGGGIRVQSTPGQGATFLWTIPKAATPRSV
jgi:PAS domain S-box-containing protein